MDGKWEVFCLRVATRRLPASRLIAGDQGETTIPYYMWCLRGDAEAIVVDTGLSKTEGNKRGLDTLEAPEDALRKIGVDSRDVTRVVTTHLHGDHFSAWDAYPNAQFTLQADDLSFFCGPAAKYYSLVRPAPDLSEVMKLNYAGRLDVISGDRHFTDGVELVQVGGHTPGSQVITVDSAERGRVVICGDAVDLYRSLDLMEPSPGSTSRTDNVMAFDKITALVDGDRDRLFPGHEILLADKGEEQAPSVFRMA
jgi:glyoxylase-like metal-dependent hydrolase (beta-lactamase superfamily II)